MNIEEGKAVLFDRRDGDPPPGQPDLAFRMMHRGEIICVSLWATDWPAIFSGEIISLEDVIGNAKFYGFTEKQARDAAAQDAEF